MSTKKKNTNQMNNKQAKAIAKQAAADAVKRERKLNRKIAKQHGNQLIARTGDLGAGNMYLKCLLNPEQYQTSYPDNYDKKTAVVQFISNRTLQFDQEDGQFKGEVHPTLKGHLVLDGDNPATTKHYISINSFSPKGIAIKAAGPRTNIPVNPPSDEDSGTFLDVIDGATIQLPKLASAGSAYAKWATTADAQVNVALTTQAGVDIMLTNDMNTAAVIPVGTTSVAVTAAVTAGVTQALSTIMFKLYLPVADDSMDKPHFNVTSYSDLVGGDPGDGETPICEEYRVVGMSTLITFEGDVLYNGGAIAARILEGGETAGNLGINSYASLASLPNSWEGPLKTGLYSFWKPSDERDMYFRDPEEEDLKGDLPFLVFAGFTTHPANVVVRLRTCLVAEIKTAKPFMSTSFSVVDPKQIADAAILLRGMPQIMENPIHLESIKNFLKGLVEKGERVYEAGAKIAPYAIPLAKAVGSFLL